MKTLIVGQGAIGLLWYSQLKIKTKQAVQLLPSERYNIEEKHVNFTDNHGSHHNIPLQLANSNFIRDCELVLLCVKAFHIPDALTRISKLISPSCIIVLCHNGMLSDAQVDTALTEGQTVISMMVTHGSKKTAALSIVHTGIGQIDLGVRKGEISNNTTSTLIAHLSTALAPISWHDNIKAMQWQKLAVNCVINPICAINDASNKEVLKEKYQQNINDILNEFIAVANAHDVLFELASLKQVVLNVAQLTGDNICSTLADIRAHRQSEIDYLNGFICREGEALGIATPMNKSMWQRVRRLTEVGIKDDKL